MDKKKPIRLSDLPKRDTFKAPDGYFENLPDRITDRIKATEKGKVRRLEITRMIAYAVAASLALILIVWGGLNLQQKNDADLLAEVSSEDFIAYLKNTEGEIDELLQTKTLQNFSGMEIDSLYIPDEELPEEQLLQEFLLDDFVLVEPDSNKN